MPDAPIGVNSVRMLVYLGFDADGKPVTETKFEDRIVNAHPVRVKAFEVLLHWDVDFPLPKSAKYARI